MEKKRITKEEALKINVFWNIEDESCWEKISEDIYRSEDGDYAKMDGRQLYISEYFDICDETMKKCYDFKMVIINNKNKIKKLKMIYEKMVEEGKNRLYR